MPSQGSLSDGIDTNMPASGKQILSPEDNRDFFPQREIQGETTDFMPGVIWRFLMSRMCCFFVAQKVWS